jgi:hypothetical protein
MFQHLGSIDWELYQHFSFHKIPSCFDSTCSAAAITIAFASFLHLRMILHSSMGWRMDHVLFFSEAQKWLSAIPHGEVSMDLHMFARCELLCCIQRQRCFLC